MPALTAIAALLAAIVPVIASPDTAPADWTIWKKLDLGYIAGIPPGFHELAPTDGDSGMAFSFAGGDASLVVLSGPLGPGGVAAEYARQRDSFLDGGGTLSIELSGEAEASFIGVVDGRGVRTRIRSECEGRRHLTFILPYSEALRTEIAPLASEIAERLMQIFCPSGPASVA